MACGLGERRHRGAAQLPLARPRRRRAIAAIHAFSIAPDLLVQQPQEEMLQGIRAQPISIVGVVRLDEGVVLKEPRDAGEGFGIDALG